MDKFDKTFNDLTKGLDIFEPSNWKYFQHCPLPSRDFNEEISLKLNLIEENKHLEVNVGQKALGYLKSCLAKDEPTKVDIEVLRDKILPTWKYYDDFYIACSNYELWLAKIDFNEIEKADELIRQIDPSFNDKFGKNNGSYGLFIKLGEDRYIILMDEKAAKNEKKIQHEFTHFIQIVRGILVADTSLLTKKLSEALPLSKDLIKYVCSPLEFWTHIYIDLFNGLQKIYWLKFKDVYNWEEFISIHFDNLHVQDLKNAAIIRIWKEIIRSNSFYFPILVAIQFVDPSFYREIIEKLKNKKTQDD